MEVHGFGGHGDGHTVLVLQGHFLIWLGLSYLRVDGEAAKVDAGLHDGVLRVIIHIAVQLVLGFGPLDDLPNLVLCQSDGMDAVPSVSAEGCGKGVGHNTSAGLILFSALFRQASHIDLMRPGGLREGHASGHADGVRVVADGDEAHFR